MTLSEGLERLPANRCLLVSEHDEQTSEQLLVERRTHREKLTGVRVGTHIADAATAFHALAALDGEAEAIALFSPSADAQLVERLALGSGLDVLLSDSLEIQAALAGKIPVHSTLSGLASSWKTKQRGSETRWVLTTSGTTNEPKLVSHTLQSLTRTTKLDVARSAGVSWGMLYDYTRFAGLQVVLQSLLSGATLILPAPDASLTNKIAMFSEHGCTHLSGTPTLWRKLLMTESAEKLKLRQVTLGGEIADDRILGGIAAFYPQARVVHIFASTEAGVGFSVTDKRAGFPVSFLTDPPSGIEIKIDGNRLFLRNTLVAGSYLGGEVSFVDGSGWIDTGDSVLIEGDRVLFQGRTSGVINVGGDKVHPEEVESVLLAHPLVAGTRVYARSNPITGQLVAADIVLREPKTDPREAKTILQSYVQSKLGPRKAPAIIRIVADLELNTAGKVTRRSL